MTDLSAEQNAPPENERDWRYVRCSKGHKALLAWDIKRNVPMAICEICREAVYSDTLKSGKWGYDQ